MRSASAWPRYLLAGWLAAWLGATGAIGQAAEPPPPPVKIRINTAGLFGEAGLFLAYDKGYFKAEGLDVELVTTASTNSSSDTLTELAGGELDLGTMSLSAGLFNALNRGIGIVGLLPLNTRWGRVTPRAASWCARTWSTRVNTRIRAICAE
jgi:ABC-type nitrate/sulfonate/bicarbonate transport system substrate-binding protein